MKFLIFCLIFVVCGCRSAEKSFWHLEKDHSNIWWFVSPTNEKIFLLGVTSLHPVQYGISPPHYQSPDFKNIDQWAKYTSQRVLNYGFQGAGAWSNPAIFKFLPYTKDLNLSLYTKRHISDPLWEKDIEEALKGQLSPNDQNLIGYFTDNELNWDVLENYSEKYFRVMHSLLQKYDPNHLNLGVRFNRRPSHRVLVASKGKVDVHSFNCYTDGGTVWHGLFKDTYDITGVPIMISEFSSFARENNSNNPNRYPDGKQLFSGLVDTQKNRADVVTRFITESSSCPFIIGAEWFQWNDEPPAGRKSDGESYNFGLVDIYDQPYVLLIKSFQDASKQAQTIHSKASEGR